MSEVVQREGEAMDAAVARLDPPPPPCGGLGTRRGVGDGRLLTAGASAAAARTPPGRELVTAAAQAVRGAAARVAFMWNQQPPPRGEAAVGLLAALRVAVEALCLLLDRRVCTQIVCVSCVCVSVQVW